MSRQEFFAELKKELREIDPSERQEVLQYYEEYFADAGIENEQAVLQELGSPKKIAAQLKSSGGKSVEQPQKPRKSIFMIILSIFAAPIALPLALAGVALAFALLLTGGCFLLAVLLASFSFALAGIFVSITSVAIIPTNVGSFFLMLGIGLILGALSILIFIPTLQLCKKFVNWFGNFVQKKMLRRKQNV